MSAHWTAALWTLGAGLGMGAIGSLAISRSPVPPEPEKTPKSRKGQKKAASAKLSTAQIDLVAQRDAALARLKELDSGSASAEERRTLELAAARAMRDLEATAAEEPEPAAVAPQALPTGLLQHRWVWAVGSAAFTLAVVLGLQSFTAPRAPGGSITGGTGMPPTTAPTAMAPSGSGAAQHPEMDAPTDPTITALEAKVAQQPENMDLKLDLADAYLSTESGAVKAFQQTKQVLAKDPESARGLTQQAAVRGMMGQSQAAFDGADRAVHNDPKLVMGWVVRGRAAIALGKMDMAELSFAKAIALDPEAAQPLKAELREASGKGSAPEAIPAAQPQAAPAGNPISGTVELDPSVGTPPDGAFVFVIARDAASPSPMPAAAKRLPARDFPLHFTLGAEDAVMGRPLPDRITLEARLDTDGNATTRAPTDPIARQEQVSMGTSGLKLVLRAP